MAGYSDYYSTIARAISGLPGKTEEVGQACDSLKAAIAAGFAQGLEFIQRTQLAAPGRGIYNIFGDRRWITKYPQIRIAVGLIVAALVGIFRGIFLSWIIPENNLEANSHSLISAGLQHLGKTARELVHCAVLLLPTTHLKI